MVHLLKWHRSVYINNCLQINILVFQVKMSACHCNIQACNRFITKCQLLRTLQELTFKIQP